MASYSPVFSAQFIVYGNGAGSLVFIVPAGFTAVIRDASIFQLVGGVTCPVYIQNTVSAPQMCPIYIAADGALNYAQWQGRVVVPENGIIQAEPTTVGSGVSVYAGGYLLRNVAA